MSTALPEYPLIGPDDPAPFSLYNEKGTAKTLIVCDHASAATPRLMGRLGLAGWVFQRHMAYDIGAADVARVLAERLDAPAILSGYSRLIVDPNRRLDDPTAFVQVSDGVAIPANLELSDEERGRRVASFRDPYHAAITARIGQFRSCGITPAVVAVHSCTPIFAQVVRRWHVGVMWDRDPRIAVPLIERLGAIQDICVGDNEPYSGRDDHDFTLDHHAEAQGLPYVGIEVRQDLIGDQEGARRWGGILADALTPILAAEELYRPWRPPSAVRAVDAPPARGRDR